MSTVKSYSWKDIMVKLNLNELKPYNDQYRYAEEYFRIEYCGNDDKIKFSEQEVKTIIKEIIEEAEHKIRLLKNDDDLKHLRKDWPNIDDYVEYIINR